MPSDARSDKPPVTEPVQPDNLKDTCQGTTGPSARECPFVTQAILSMSCLCQKAQFKKRPWTLRRPRVPPETRYSSIARACHARARSLLLSQSPIIHFSCYKRRPSHRPRRHFRDGHRPIIVVAPHLAVRPPLQQPAFLAEISIPCCWPVPPAPVQPRFCGGSAAETCDFSVS